ncbi:type II toxin-antitoxin system HipA family toxin [Helicobacter turcicus]|uniref:HipA domain-containing protein n=1 Tax=Helicobacter turcicus TaxID=2867412 RepID=A0ABS7JLZ9_9HELI|nr:HipA domain-containing protein [Helicobacter turcicus]MBX7490414.1 HipA domain-containing protein [Helicobacter turcicus]MBX7545272.1 HipA domain-containing protein [Helicobacter turcicus]
MIQKRAKARELSKAEYLIGVSDYFRIGALRVKQNHQFVSASNDIPKLFFINELIESARLIEKGESRELDIQRLLHPSGSLGGARPKASILKDNELYIAKFQSLKDEDKQLVRLEKTLLDLAKICKIDVVEAKIFSKNNAEVLLIKRFDRENGTRIPFKSAMTLLNVSENEGINAQKSYVDIAKKLEQTERKKLFKRMLFNAFFANTDDHLRNHGLLLKDGKWILSPAYDLTPEFIEPHKQYHALNFIANESLTDLMLFDKIKGKFNTDSEELKEILKDIDSALNSVEKIAKNNGLNSDNLKAFKKCLEHKDRMKFANLIKK